MRPSPGAAYPARPEHERGFAAAAAMLALLLASAIGTSMAELARLELVLARQRKATTAALAGVDACVESVVGSLPAGWDFSELLNGSDGVAGTADDGLVPLAADCTGMGRPAPGAPDPPRFLLEVEAMRRGGRRRLEAVVRRRAEPGIPALLWVADAAAIGRVGGTLVLDGGDIASSRPPVSMLAAPAEPPLLDSWVAAQGGALVAANGTQAPMWSPPPPVSELAARAAAGGALAPAAGLVAGPPAVPGVTLSTGDLSVTSPSFGAGVLVVDGLLRIAAPLTFTGVVAATGGLHVEATGLLDLQGALWLGPGALEALVVEGSASVVASAAGLAGADALLPLPRRAGLASVRDF